MFNLEKLQKKAQTGSNKIIFGLIAVVIGISVSVALAPTIFADLATLAADTNVPSWLPTTLVVVVAAGLLLMISKAAGMGGKK